MISVVGTHSRTLLAIKILKIFAQHPAKKWKADVFRGYIWRIILAKPARYIIFRALFLWVGEEFRAFAIFHQFPL